MFKDMTQHISPLRCLPKLFFAASEAVGGPGPVVGRDDWRGDRATP